MPGLLRDQSLFLRPLGWEAPNPDNWFGVVLDGRLPGRSDLTRGGDGSGFVANSQLFLRYVSDCSTFSRHSLAYGSRWGLS